MECYITLKHVHVVRWHYMIFGTTATSNLTVKVQKEEERCVESVSVHVDKQKTDEISTQLIMWVSLRLAPKYIYLLCRSTY